MNRRCLLPRLHLLGTTQAERPSRPRGCRCLTAASCSPSRLLLRRMGNGVADLDVPASLLIEARLGGENMDGL